MTISIPRELALLATVAIAGAGCTPGGGETSGIDGTGVRAPVVAAAYGRMTGDGGFVVNGITYDTTNTAVTIDDAPATIGDVAAGDVVLVTGTLDSTIASTGVAQKATLEHAVVGPVDSIDSGNGVLVALGQTVQLSGATFDASVPGAALSGLAVGDIVAVSGFRNQRSDVIASRIAKRPSGSGGLRATGRVASLDASTRRFAINTLTVDYSSAVVTAGPSGALAIGDVVEVSGTSVGSAGELLAERVTFKPTDVIASTGAYVNLEGYLTALNANDAQSFEVAGLPITTTAATETTGALAFDTRTAVKGALAASGTLVASDVQTALPTFNGTHTLRGEVFDAYQGPVANVAIFVWVDTGRGGYSWSEARSYSTDSAGHFEVSGLPDASDARVFISAYRQGFFQPCAVTLQMTSDVTRNIELVSAQTLSSLQAPAPQTAHDPTLTGTVYEMTAAGRQPVAGANVIVDGLVGMGLVIATTQTDLSGHYFLCDWPSGPTVIFEAYKQGYIGTTGYIASDFGPVDPPQSTTHDFELQKQ